MWLVLVAVAAAFYLTRGWIEPGPALRGALLRPDLPRAEAYRLVTATFLHTSFFPLLFAVFLLLRLGGEVEDRAGQGGFLGLLVLGGAALNLVRVLLEPYPSLEHLAGAWPVGLAMGGAALTLGVRQKDGGGVLRALGFEVVLLLFLAWLSNLLDARLVGVFAASFGLGAAYGAVYPLGPARRSVGPLLGAIALLALVGAWRGSRTAPPGDPTLLPLPELSERQVKALRVAISLPASWSEHPQPKTVECGDCDEKVEFPAGLADDPIPAPKRCPKCSEEVLHGARQVAVYVDSTAYLKLTAQPPNLLVYSAPRGPYDAPDTLAARLLEQLRENQLFAKVPIEEERFVQNHQLGEGYRFTLATAQGKPRARLYVFVGRRRTLLLRFMHDDPGPGRRGYQDAIFDAIAASARRYDPPPEPKPPASAAEQPQAPPPEPR
ncbi:MAG: rhomboid family intramembrane serine protease [Planctomycetota bacterium]